MDIRNNALSSYQSNQRLANALPSLDNVAEISAPDAEQPLPDDAVILSEKRQIFSWLAQQFPQPMNSTADINRLNQSLHDYGLIDLADIKQVNQILTQADQPNSVLDNLKIKHQNSQSYSEQQQLGHLIQVYATLEAATQLAA